MGKEETVGRNYEAEVVSLTKALEELQEENKGLREQTKDIPKYEQEIVYLRKTIGRIAG